MTTSLKRRSLSKPKRNTRIGTYDLGFARARARNKAHSMLLEEFAESGLTKAELAKMLGKRPEQITRWLAGPANLTLDTISDLLFAITGNFVSVNSSDELSKPSANNKFPVWLEYPTGTPDWKVVKVGTRMALGDDKAHRHTPQYYWNRQSKTEETREHGKYSRFEIRDGKTFAAVE